MAIDEADFDRMHKTVSTVYGWVDDPAILPDIILVIERLQNSNSGKKYDIEAVVK
jgi:hypothetical protein